MVTHIANGLVQSQTPVTSPSELPTSVQVGPYKFDIKYVDVVTEHMEKKPDDKETVVNGCVEFNLQTIYIANSQKPDMMADTILHEINHAMWACVGGWGHEDIDEEMVVSMITTIQLDTMRRNKDIYKYLIGIE